MSSKIAAAALVAMMNFTGLAAHAWTASADIASPTNPTQIAGDFDGDGDVDGRDFLIWQR